MLPYLYCSPNRLCPTSNGVFVGLRCAVVPSVLCLVSMRSGSHGKNMANNFIFFWGGNHNQNGLCFQRCTKRVEQITIKAFNRPGDATSGWDGIELGTPRHAEVQWPPQVQKQQCGCVFHILLLEPGTWSEIALFLGSLSK